MLHTSSSTVQLFGFSTFWAQRAAHGLKGFQLISHICGEQTLLFCKRDNCWCTMLTDLKETSAVPSPFLHVFVWDSHLNDTFLTTILIVQSLLFPQSLLPTNGLKHCWKIQPQPSSFLIYCLSLSLSRSVSHSHFSITHSTFSSPCIYFQVFVIFTRFSPCLWAVQNWVDDKLYQGYSV